MEMGNARMDDARMDNTRAATTGVRVVLRLPDLAWRPILVETLPGPAKPTEPKASLLLNHRANGEAALAKRGATIAWSKLRLTSQQPLVMLALVALSLGLFFSAFLGNREADPTMDTVVQPPAHPLLHSSDQASSNSFRSTPATQASVPPEGNHIPPAAIDRLPPIPDELAWPSATDEPDMSAQADMHYQPATPGVAEIERRIIDYPTEEASHESLGPSLY
jgi:hypothetical protein